MYQRYKYSLLVDVIERLVELLPSAGFQYFSGVPAVLHYVYLKQYTLKSGCNKFKRAKIHGTASYWKACLRCRRYGVRSWVGRLQWWQRR